MKTFDQIVTSMRTLMRSKWPNVVQIINTIVDDIVVKAFATEQDRMYREVQYYQYIRSVSGFRYILGSPSYQDTLKDVFGLSSSAEVQAMVSLDLDEFATSYGVTPRLAGSKATTTETLFYASGNLVTVSAGQQFTVPLSTPLVFEVSRTITGNPVFRSTGLYVLFVDINAQEVGTQYNVPANSITAVTGGVAGVIGLTNEQDILDGEDQESDNHLLDRIEIWLQGLSIDTPQGVKKKILESGVRDAYVVAPGNINRVRAPGVDVWCLSKVYTTVVEDFTWTTSTRDFGYVPTKQPINDVTTNYILSGFADCAMAVVKDSGTNAFGLSKYGRDRIVFTFPTTSPTLGDTVTVTYQYNSSLDDILALFKEPNLELFTDLLMKEAVEKRMYIKVRIKAYPDVQDLEALRATLIDETKAAMNILDLGVSYDQSDLITLYGTTEGVDRVVLEVYDFLGSTGMLQTPPVAFNEYLSIADVNIVISFELA